MKTKYLIPLVVVWIIFLSGCSSERKSNVWSYIDSKTNKYTEELPKAIVESSIYLSSSIVFAAFIKGLLSSK